MSLLIEKRQEFVNKLAQLENERTAKIEAAIETYRQQLEAQTPTTDIDRVKHVISALDEVIAYEGTPTAEVATPVVQVAQVLHAEGRPGMAEVFSPQR